MSTTLETMADLFKVKKLDAGSGIALNNSNDITTYQTVMTNGTESQIQILKGKLQGIQEDPNFLDALETSKSFLLKERNDFDFSIAVSGNIWHYTEPETKKNIICGMMVKDGYMLAPYVKIAMNGDLTTKMTEVKNFKNNVKTNGTFPAALTPGENEANKNVKAWLTGTLTLGNDTVRWRGLYLSDLLDLRGRKGDSRYYYRIGMGDTSLDSNRLFPTTNTVPEGFSAVRCSYYDESKYSYDSSTPLHAQGIQINSSEIALSSIYLVGKNGDRPADNTNGAWARGGWKNIRIKTDGTILARKESFNNNRSGISDPGVTDSNAEVTICNSKSALEVKNYSEASAGEGVLLRGDGLVCANKYSLYKTIAEEESDKDSNGNVIKGKYHIKQTPHPTVFTVETKTEQNGYFDETLRRDLLTISVGRSRHNLVLKGIVTVNDAMTIKDKTTIEKGLTVKGTFTNPSDKRKKILQNFLDERESLILLRESSPIKFYYKDDNEKNLYYGLYAQDIRDLLIKNNIANPSLLVVKNLKNNSMTNNLLAPEKDVEYYLNYTAFITPLIKGWQYHDKKILELEKENAKLQEIIKNLI